MRMTFESLHVKKKTLFVYSSFICFFLTPSKNLSQVCRRLTSLSPSSLSLLLHGSIVVGLRSQHRRNVCLNRAWCVGGSLPIVEALAVSVNC